MSLPVTLIFPMAGQGARFGYQFKPFLEIDGQPFIAAAFAPFRDHLADISRVKFVFLAEQERAHDVTARIDALFCDVAHDSVILAHATDGPAETLRQCIEARKITGPIVVCDCDHAIDVAPLLARARDSHAACIIPTWDIGADPLTAWGIAGIDGAGRVRAIAEKALPTGGDIYRGVIGCYYFASADEVMDILADKPSLYISDIIQMLLDRERHVEAVPTGHARFFGDPERLAIAQRSAADSGAGSDDAVE